MRFDLYYECKHCEIAWEEKSEDEFEEADCERCGCTVDPSHAFPDLGISI